MAGCDLEKSNYNVVKTIKGKTWVFNTLSSSFVCLDTEVWNQLPQGDDATVSQLIRMGILVKSHDEEYLKYKYYCGSKMFDHRALSLTIAPTMMCNFDCPYCFEGKHKNLPPMTDDVIDHLVQFIDVNKAKEIGINWFGGEPLLAFPVILKICEALEARQIKYTSSMVTNGSLLRHEVVEAIAPLHLRRLQISLDGVGEEHNRRRSFKDGRPSFQVIMDNLDDFLQHTDIKVVLQVSVDHINPNAFGHVHDYVEKRYAEFLSAGRLCLTSNNIQDRTGFEGHDACFSDEQIFRNNVYQIENNKYPELLPGLPGLSLPCMHRSVGNYAIDSEGYVYKCLEYLGCPEKSVGNLSEGKIAFSKLASATFVEDPFEDSVCRTCAVFPICGGGCPIDRVKKREGRIKSCCSYYKDYLADLLPLFYTHYYKDK